MIVQGRIKKIMPLRSGVSQRTGNEWQALPFVFEYFEEDNARTPDSVLLETYDTNVIQNLKEGMEVKINFGHRTREYEGKVYNELRLYKIESVRGQQSSQQGAQQANAQAADNQSQQQNNGATAPQNQGGQNNANDDLPF